MFAVLRRHQKWFWAAIIAVVIPSFVVFFSPDIGRGSRGGNGDYGSVYGRPITQNEIYDAYKEAQLSFLFNYGSWPGRDEANRFGFDLDQQSRTRVLLTEEVKRFGIHSSEEAAAKWVANAFRDRRQGVFRPESYDQFVRQMLPEQRMSEMDMERFVANQVSIQHLISLVGINGTLVTPKEAEVLYRREHEQLEAEAVIFSATNYLATIKIETNDLAQFYTNRMAVYAIPDRVQVRYVLFNVTNFMAEADETMAKETNFSRRIDEIYQARGANYYVDTNGAVMAEAAAKAKIKDEARREFALLAAKKKASAFAVDLFNVKNAMIDELNKLAATNKLTVQTTEPFTANDGPVSIKVFANFTKAAFALTTEEPFAQPMDGEDGVFVFGLDKKLPKENPPFEAIKLRVTEDYRRVQSMTAARKAATDFMQKATNSLAQGKTFTNICELEKVVPIALPAFSLSSRDLPGLDSRLDFSSLRDQMANLQPGKAVYLYSSRDGGAVAYLRNRVAAKEDDVKKDLPDYLKSLRQSRVSEAFNEWLNRETQVAQLTLPETKNSKNAKK
jgi:hypothetical protein